MSGWLLHLLTIFIEAQPCYWHQLFVQEERVVLVLLQDGTARDQHVHQ